MTSKMIDLMLVATVLFLIGIIFQVPVNAAVIGGPDCALEWDAVDDPRVERYRFYADGQKTAEVPKNILTITCAAAQIAKKKDTEVYVTAYGQGQESAPSNKLVVWYDDSPLAAPGKLLLRVKVPSK